MREQARTCDAGGPLLKSPQRSALPKRVSRWRSCLKAAKVVGAIGRAAELSASVALCRGLCGEACGACGRDACHVVLGPAPRHLLRGSSPLVRATAGSAALLQWFRVGVLMGTGRATQPGHSIGTRAAQCVARPHVATRTDALCHRAGRAVRVRPAAGVEAFKRV
jgi:hypothetical protein